MTQNIERRLDALEQSISGDEATIVRILSFVSPGVPAEPQVIHSLDKAHKWNRRDDETADVFRARVTDEAGMLRRGLGIVVLRESNFAEADA